MYLNFLDKKELINRTKINVKYMYKMYNIQLFFINQVVNFFFFLVTFTLFICN